MNRLVAVYAWIMISLVFSGKALAAVIRVGPEGDVRSIAEASQRAQSGDVIEISSGDWHGDVALWDKKDLIIRGVGARPVLHADGKDMEGKAIWVFRRGTYIVENIEFRGARVTDGNGAGIRFESGKLRVSNCSFVDNENGILTGNSKEAELEIENSLFADAPRKESPLPHLLYIGRIASVKVSGSRFQSGYAGHLIKSRARITDISYNLIVDGPSGSASYEVEFPNGGNVKLIGNVIGQSSNTRNPILVAYGAEGADGEGHSLTLSHNTFLSEGLRPAWFIRVWKNRVPREFKMLAVNNLYSGLGIFNYGISGIFDGNWLVPHSSFLSWDTLDFRLVEDSVYRQAMFAASDIDDALVPKREFKLPLGTERIGQYGRMKPGAFQ
ncbi:MAG: hypothetical protein H6R13_1407 [Proteobacteria bacterium]|nr:hypothetical protein [Pseudomonadota bacterium]